MLRDFIRTLILQSMAKVRILAQMQPDLRFYLFAVLSPGFGILYFFIFFMLRASVHFACGEALCCSIKLCRTPFCWFDKNQYIVRMVSVKSSH